MPAPPTWSAPSGSGGVNGTMSSPGALIAAEAASEAAAVLLETKPFPKTDKERRRMERERDRLEKLDREREREKERERERQHQPAMIIPAPSYVFTILIPSAALFDTVPDILAIWGTQANAPAFSSSASNNTTVMMTRATSSSASRAPKKEKEASAATAAANVAPVEREASGGDMWEGTIGYTDDSDVRLMVLHAGFVTLDEMRAAKLGLPSPHANVESLHAGRSAQQRRSAKERERPAISAKSLAVMSETQEKESNERTPALVSSGGKRDLAVHLLWRGVKSRFKSSLGPVSGGSIQSAAWGTSHDGGALEIERIEWLPVSLFSPPFRSYLILLHLVLTDGCVVLGILLLVWICPLTASSQS